jgi:mRNA-degrading endonuclease RelE of RelBE toxin-antitoxin system
MFTINYAKSAITDLEGLRAFDRKKILDSIEAQLTHQPNQESRNRKTLTGLVPRWEHENPTWELRVGAFRIFYDMNEEADRVTVRAIRRKPPHKTTEDIL